MVKAYDLKELGVILKGNGLELLEESSKIIFDSVMDWLEESAKVSPTPYDDLIGLVSPQIRKIVNEKLEDINKADNE